MNLQDTGTPRRPKLSLAYGGRRTATVVSDPGPSGNELRRIVAAMIG